MRVYVLLRGNYEFRKEPVLARIRAMSEKESLELEAQIQKDVLSSPNLAEAIRANLDKRPPEFFD